MQIEGMNSENSIMEKLLLISSGTIKDLCVCVCVCVCVREREGGMREQEYNALSRLIYIILYHKYIQVKN
jgi:hypothetical protein